MIAVISADTEARVNALAKELDVDPSVALERAIEAGVSHLSGLPKLVEAILVDVNLDTGVSRAQMLSTCREKTPTAARHELWRRLRKHGFSLKELGRMMQRDHTTILMGIRKAEAKGGRGAFT